jgi:purine-binding chemotaxis protein CheW
MSSISKNAFGKAAAAGSLEFLAFKLGGEEYGVDIQKVQELRGYDAVTAIANAPAYLKGVVNLRGIIVPIVDLRIKFGLGDPSYDMFTVVIILNIKGQVMGVVVDSVSDVTTLTADQVKPAPALSFHADYLIGLGAIKQRLLLLIDMDLLLQSDDLALPASAADVQACTPEFA